MDYSDPLNFYATSTFSLGKKKLDGHPTSIIQLLFGPLTRREGEVVYAPLYIRGMYNFSSSWGYYHYSLFSLPKPHKKSSMWNSKKIGC
jgi:hypothetical protein